MKKIKFRLWNNIEYKPQYSKYFYDTEQTLECLKQQLLFNDNSILGYDHIGEGCSFEQFTGLTDKNGNDIYEGDILKRKTVFDDSSGVGIHIGIVTWDDCNYYSHSIKNEISRSLGGKPKHTTYEVIGNIHENKELLNK